MNNIQHIYANGCSFTSDNFIRYNLGKSCYPEIIAQHRGVSCTNAALPGSCNRRIIRNTLRDTLAFDSTTLVIVQLTFLTRTEKPYTPGQNNEWKMEYANEEYHESIKDNSNEPINQKYFETYMRFFDEQAELTNLAADIIMLTGYLRSKQIPYFVFSYAPLITNAIPSVSHDLLQQSLSCDSAVLNIITDSLVSRLDKGNWFYDPAPGHLSAEGHQHAAEVLEKLLSNLCGEQE
jgi:hypothetical protein